MTVRIVEPAPDKQVTCHRCKTRLSYSYNDVVETIEADYTGCKETTYRIICPVCQSKPRVSMF